eukprot:TRINITY_DN21986_c0_g1_i3.p4 TRINITY_DN21986_c0_g1~~TRINITY_DN21986_c0_g1_i3.p4  ORF type:complete len:119 (+),score=21.00 TRINITY_DN21986_c0_g1_i3:148-504(+)
MEIGQDENEADKKGREQLMQLQGRFRQGGRNWVNPLRQHSQDVKQGDKLRTADQVRKTRKVKQKNRQRHVEGQERNRQKSAKQGGNAKQRGGGNAKQRGGPGKLKGVQKHSKKSGKRK